MSTQFNNSEKSKKGEKTKMIMKSVYFDNRIWKKSKAKAGKRAMNLSAVLRRLLELWLNGKIDLSDYENE